MSAFRPINTTKFLHSKQDKTNDFSYWKQLSQPTIIKENSIIDYIDFSSIRPHNFAVTCSVRIQIYNPITKALASTISKFQKNCYGATFGKNDQLLACGDEEGYVKIFETSTKRNLRSFHNHTAAVHRTYFTADKLHIASFSDDRTVRLWDISNESCVTTFEDAHTDYIRAGCVSPVSPDILLSGGYDGKINMFDRRTNSSVFQCVHDSVVHSVMFLQTGGIFISAGKSHVKFWDAFAGGRLLGIMSTHNKDITCLRLACNGRRLLSGGLDRKVKIYDATTYQTVHSLDFPNGITSMAIAPDDETLVVGMTDGTVSVQRMDTDRQIKTIEKRKTPKVIVSDEQFVADYKREKEARYQKMLRKFEYSKALKEVFKSEFTNRTPHITIAVMVELMRRKGLERALKGQPDSQAFLIQFIAFIIRFIGDRRFIKSLIDISNILLDVCADDFSDLNGNVARKFLELSKALRREEDLLIDCLELRGAFDLLLSGADVAEQSTELIEYGREINKLEPSNTVEEDFVIGVDE